MILVSQSEVALQVSGAMNSCDIESLLTLKQCVVQIEPEREYFRYSAYSNIIIFNILSDVA
jgi:hypothetical protein